jgi:hypothetical protein
MAGHKVCGTDLNHFRVVTGTLGATAVTPLPEEAVIGHIHGIGNIAGNIEQSFLIGV